MALVLDKNESALRRGIRTAGIGKKGSKNLDPELISEIIGEIKERNVTPAALGAFLGALIIKGVSAEERRLEDALESGILEDPVRLARYLTSEAPDEIQETCGRLLANEHLSREEACHTGRFLFSKEPGDGARGIIASVLRVRYETPDEYMGLLDAMKETLRDPFKRPVPEGDPVLQLSEPFDGTDHSYLITPLLAADLQNEGYRSVMMTGRNSGPKFGNNLRDVLETIEEPFAQNNSVLARKKPTFGWILDQELLSPAIDRWVDIRRQIIKRPFLATLEKFLNPANARILISSAFHPPYSEKMMTITERAGFPGGIVVRNGIEGTIAFGLKRPAKILCSVRQKHGPYRRHEFEFEAEQFLEENIPVDEKLETVSTEKNAELIRQFQTEGKTGNPLFNKRVKATLAGLKKALRWVEENIDG